MTLLTIAGAAALGAAEACALSLDVAGAELFLMSSCLYLQALPFSHFPFWNAKHTPSSFFGDDDLDLDFPFSSLCSVFLLWENVHSFPFKHPFSALK